MIKPWVGAVLLPWAMLQSGPAAAQAPFYTDDTGVTEPGTLHVEAFDEIDALQSTQYPDFRQNTANLKVNVGLPNGFELDVDTPYLTIDRTGAMRSSRGVGDTNLGVKWNLREPSATSRVPAFAVSFYTEFPTGDSRQELGSGVTDYWLNLIAQIPVSDRTRFNVNLGVLFAGNTSTGVVGIETTRGHVYTGGLSWQHDFSPRLTIGGEVYGGMADNNGLDRTQLQAMLGAQYAVRDGMTLFMGLVAGTFSASPRLGGQIGIAFDVPHLFESSSRAASLRSSSAPADHLKFHLPLTGDVDDL
jgi:hypothetical protein